MIQATTKEPEFERFVPADERESGASPYFPKSHGRKLVDDRRILIGTIKDHLEHAHRLLSVAPPSDADPINESESHPRRPSSLRNGQ